MKALSKEKMTEFRSTLQLLQQDNQLCLQAIQQGDKSLFNIYIQALKLNIDKLKNFYQQLAI